MRARIILLLPMTSTTITIEFAGVVESFEFIRPHPVLKLKGEDGCLWTLGVAQRWWNRAELPEDSIKAGDELIVIGWPARDSSAEMLLRGFEIKGSERIIFQDPRDRQQQPTGKRGHHHKARVY